MHGAPLPALEANPHGEQEAPVAECLLSIPIRQLDASRSLLGQLLLGRIRVAVPAVAGAVHFGFISGPTLTIERCPAVRAFSVRLFPLGHAPLVGVFTWVGLFKTTHFVLLTNGFIARGLCVATHSDAHSFDNLSVPQLSGSTSRTHFAPSVRIECRHSRCVGRRDEGTHDATPGKPQRSHNGNREHGVGAREAEDSVGVDHPPPLRSNAPHNISSRLDHPPTSRMSTDFTSHF